LGSRLNSPNAGIREISLSFSSSLETQREDIFKKHKFWVLGVCSYVCTYVRRMCTQCVSWKWSTNKKL
jgi:hypothetical protein